MAEPEPPRQVEFGILGPVEAHHGSNLVTPSPRVRALLGALLLTPGEPVDEQRLAGLLWGPAGAGRGALHTSVSRLRSWLHARLGMPEVVERTTSGYRIDVPAENVDAGRFRARLDSAAQCVASRERAGYLRAALAQWRGDVLADGAEWVRADPVVLALEHARADAARELAGLARRLGEPESALRQVGALAQARPYDEPLQAALLTLLGACGRRAEGLRLFERVRARLADELGVDPSDELRTAHQALLRDEPVAEPGTRAAEVAGPVPAQLPPDGVFLGRGTELDRLHRHVRPAENGPAVLATITGQGGIGKSALAVHAAHQVAERFPDGALYVNLQGASAGVQPLEPLEVLTWWLRVLGVHTADIAADVHEASAQFRTLLAGRRVLLVLDDARDERQVSPLLPAAPGCAAILTSRSSLAGLGSSRRFELGVLDREQSRRLLEQVVGTRRIAAEPDAAEELARWCGDLPLALRVCGARLSARPHWKVSDLAGRLREQRRRLDELAHQDVAVRSSLAMSLRGLSERAAELFDLLGMLEVVDFAAWVAAALLDVDVEQAEDLLEELADARLAEIAGRDGTGHMRFRLHDLVRIYARECAERNQPEDVRRAALGRAIGAWLDLVCRAGAAFASPFASTEGYAQRYSFGGRPGANLLVEPAEWLHAESANLAAVVAQAAEWGLHAHAWEITSAAGPFLEAGGYFETWWRCVRPALDAATSSGDVRGASAMLRSRADLHYVWGRVRQAQADMEAALSGFNECGADHSAASCMIDLAINYRDADELDRAERSARSGLRLLRRGGDPALRARGVLVLAGIFLWQRRAGAALDCLRRGWRLYRASRNGPGQADVLRWFARAEVERGEPALAVEYAERSLRLAEQAGYRMMLPLIRLTLAWARLAAGRAQAARAEVEEILALTRGRRVRAYALQVLGGVELAEGSPSVAVLSLRESLELWRALDDVLETRATEQALTAAEDATAASPG